MNRYIVFVVALVVCFNVYSQPLATNPVSPDFKSVDKSYQFYVFGDWGRMGEYHQRDLAEMMNKATAVVKPEFIFSAGDNIYPKGVASTQDPQWQKSYEDVYTGFGLNCPWYVALGNHDYLGNVQAEIDYSKVSRRWNMPARYYSFVKGGDGGLKIRFIVIDTSPFEDDYYNEDDFDGNLAAQDTTQQKRWIEQELAKEDVDWKIVVGHHPFYTGGPRKARNSSTRRHLEPLFTHYKADVYFAGHEHSLQHIKQPDKPTHLFISGSGSEVTPVVMLPASKFAQSVQGFMAVSVTKKSLQVQVLDYTGHLLYKTVIQK